MTIVCYLDRRYLEILTITYLLIRQSIFLHIDYVLANNCLHISFLVTTVYITTVHMNHAKYFTICRAEVMKTILMNEKTFVKS